MKRGIYGLKVQQVSFILLGLVCATMLALTWKKTTFLTSFTPTQSFVLELNRDEADVIEILGGENSSEQNEGNKYESVGSNGTKEITVERGNGENTISADKESLPRAIQRAGAEEQSVGKNKWKERERHLVAPANPAIEEPFVKGVQTSIILEATDKNADTKKDCNYAKGKWISDDSRPLYSGYDCKKWLSPMWSCRLTQRTDFDYEKLRWQPKDCDMVEFTASKFLKRMQDKTLAFVGDSLGRQQFQSLMCMVTGGNETSDVADVGHEYGLLNVLGARPGGWAYRFSSTNTTILFYWSASLCDLEPINISTPTTDFAMHLDRPPAFLRQYLHRFDVLVLNTGHHWNRGKLNANRWIMYVGGVPNTDWKIANIAGAKNFKVHSIVEWVNTQLPKYPGLKAFFRSISPRHFFNGEWNTGGTCDNTIPLTSGKEVLQDESGDPLTAGAVNGTSVQLLDITALSQLRDEGHISRYSINSMPGARDCLHWCLPGIPDTWNEILFAQI